MPNHFHLLIRPLTDAALSEYMQWVSCRYACDLRERTNTVGHGHIFQRRFWSAPVEGRLSFLATLRYIEANALRAALVGAPAEWRWSSFADRTDDGDDLLSLLPYALPATWAELVNTPQSEGILRKIRQSLLPKRGRPLGQGNSG
jgi:putative transposase